MKKHNIRIMAILFAATLLFVTGCGANNTTDNNNTGNNGNNTSGNNNTGNNGVGNNSNNNAGNNGSNTSGNNNASGHKNTLSEADARQVALKKAGLETATFTKQEYDANDVEYEFEFHTNEKEYDCDVNAIDGSIRNYSVENREIFD